MMSLCAAQKSPWSERPGRHVIFYLCLFFEKQTQKFQKTDTWTWSDMRPLYKIHAQSPPSGDSASCARARPIEALAGARVAKTPRLERVNCAA